MNTRRSRSAPAVSVVIETLEGRVVPSSAASAGIVNQSAAEVSTEAVRNAATVTSLAASAGTLGEPVTFTVTVRASARAGSPEGTVNIVDHGTVIQSLTLSPSTSSNARFAFSTATYTMTPQPGGSAYFFGRHAISAEFIPGGSFLKSTGRTIFTVSEPSYTSLADGVKIATIVPGSGSAVESGQTASVLYTGYLDRGGKIFDDSINDGGIPLSFTLGNGEVIAGFDAGITGMQVGETRVIVIPASQAYGKAGSPPTIPRNATLVFEVTLESMY